MSTSCLYRVATGFAHATAIAGVLFIGSLSSASAADLNADSIPLAIETYKDNQIRFKRDYAKKSINFQSTFTGASKAIFGEDYFVEFGGKVKCTVGDQNTLNRIVEWKKGQVVTVTGFIDDVTFSTLYLKRCTFWAITS